MTLNIMQCPFKTAWSAPDPPQGTQTEANTMECGVCLEREAGYLFYIVVGQTQCKHWSQRGDFDIRKTFPFMRANTHTHTLLSPTYTRAGLP